MDVDELFAAVPANYRILVVGFAYIGVALLVAAFVAAYLGRFVAVRKLGFKERLIMTWFLWDAFVHAALEGAYVFFEFSGTTKTSSHFLAKIWREYGRADPRWNNFDMCLIPMEIWTSCLLTPLCLWLVYAQVKNKPYRHFLQVVLCVSELYGGWITFGPEWVTGSKNINTSDPLLFWCHLVFFNMVWVVIPFWLLKQSWDYLVFASDLAASVYVPGMDSVEDDYVRRQQKLHSS